MKSVQLKVLASAVGLALLGAGSSSVPAAGSNSLASSIVSVQADTAATASSGRYFITFVEQGLARYDGSVAGLARTAPRMDGVSANSSHKFDINSSAAQAYRAYLEQARTQHVAAIEKVLGRKLAVHFTYDVVGNAVSAALSPAEAARIAAVPGVASVKPVPVQQLQTFRGPKFIGADKIWDGSAVPSYAAATRGAGVKVGIIDTGTNTAHPSFADDPSCGFGPSNHKLMARDCTATDGGGVCDGPDGNADTSSHGVHTGSTAAGNTIDNTVTPAPLLPNGVTMSGVAPCATVYSYRVADHSDGSLYGDYLMAAFENSIMDQVDVVNYSIGPTCGGGNPWDALYFLDMEAADIFVAASAGNTRASCTDPTGLVANNGPWQMTVAASTQDQQLSPQLTVTAPTPVDPLLVGIPLNPGSTTLTPAQTMDFSNATVVTYPANPIGCTASGGIAAATYTATDVAVLRRGTCGFSEKITKAYNAGARFVIIANNQPGTINMNTTGAPAGVAAFSILQTPGDALLAFGNTNGANTKGDYVRSAITPRQGDVLAGFSFRGPTQYPYDNLTKPDITGPGVDIYAAVSAADGSYGLMSGTSMSSPHIAGAGALVRAVHPSWSPMEVKSALMTTASVDGFSDDGTTPWTPDEVGNGRVDLSKAALAGLTMDETTDNFLAANPDGGTLDMTQLNLPSLRQIYCGTSCTFTRTFKNRLNVTGTWTLAAENPPGYTLSFTPSTFTLSPGYKQTVTITATASAPTTATIGFGRVNLSEADGRSPDQHLSVALADKPPMIEVDPTSLSASQLTNTTTSTTLNVSNVGGQTLNWNFAATGIGAIWDQPKAGTSGLVSDRSSTANNGAYSAADFATPIDAAVTKLTAYGFDNSNTLPSQAAITWRIYKSTATPNPDVIFANGFDEPVAVVDEPDGSPVGDTGTPVWTYTAAPTSAGVTITGSGQIALDLAAAGQSLNLPAGRYWLTVFPTYANNIAASGQPRWNWFQAAQQGEPGKFISDAFSIADWTDAGSATGGSIVDFAFKVEGTVSCGAPWLTLTPNSGSATHGVTNAVTVTFDSTGLANGNYTANACIASNDAANPLVVVPVSLHVGPLQPIQDTGFEATTAGGGSNPYWDSLDGNDGAGGGTVFYGSAKRNGSYGAWFGAWGGGAETQYFQQSVTFPATGPAFLNYWRLLDAAPDAAGTLTISIDGTAVSTTDMSAVAADTAFVQQSIDVSTYADGAAHLVKFQYVYDDAGGTGEDGSLKIDDVTLDPTNVSTASAASNQPVQHGDHKTRR